MADLVGIIGTGVKARTQIYRTVTFKRLVELLTLKRNVLVRPRKWPDTFEDLLGQSILRIGTKDHGTFSTEHIYGQCWTLNTVSDAIWQIYSEGKDGFRLRTNVGKLLGSLKSQVADPDINCHIGRVRYLRDHELVDFGKTHFAQPEGCDSDVVAEAFMVKRRAFEHEQEVRILYQAPNAGEHGDLFPYTLDPNEIIDQILVHPLVPYADFKRTKLEIRKMGFAGEIKRSLLYKKPEGFEIQWGPRI